MFDRFSDEDNNTLPLAVGSVILIVIVIVIALLTQLHWFKECVFEWPPEPFNERHCTEIAKEKKELSKRHKNKNEYRTKEVKSVVDFEKPRVQEKDRDKNRDGK